MKLLVINGPNLNLLGLREPDIYGKGSYADLLGDIHDFCRDRGISCTCFQTNHEGSIVDKIQEAYGVMDALVINPAAYTHTSVAILDALKAVSLPTVEVHLSDIASREDFRQHSYISPVCVATITGKGFAGYFEAIKLLYERWQTQGLGNAD